MLFATGAGLIFLGLLALLIDRQAAHFIYDHVSARAHKFLDRITHYAKAGHWLAASILALAGAALARHFGARGPEIGLMISYSLAFIASLTVGSAVLHAIKLVLGRRRPRDDMEMGLYGFMPLSFNLEYNSFPSGHALTISCVAVIFICVWPMMLARLVRHRRFAGGDARASDRAFPQRRSNRRRHRADRGARSAAARFSRFCATLVLSGLAPGPEKFFQRMSRRRRIAGARHQGPVMAGGLLEEARAMQHGAALGVFRREHQPRHPRQRHCARAHGARFERDEQAGAGKPFNCRAGRAPARSTSISAWAVGSRFSRMRLPSLARSAPSADSKTAPTGTSPRAMHASASASANAMASSSVTETPLTETKPEGERIAKAIARSGLCSRRDAEKLIAEGRVKLDGETVTSPARNVGEHNVIQVDDKPLEARAPARLWRYHKPAGLVTTHKDEKNRPTVFASLPPSLGRVVSVGRLDFNSEGLLLLTNDGEIARRLEIPSSGWVRKYRARLFGKVTQADLEKLATGATIAGVTYGPILADLERSKGVPIPGPRWSLQRGQLKPRSQTGDGIAGPESAQG